LKLGGYGGKSVVPIWRGGYKWEERFNYSPIHFEVRELMALCILHAMQSIHGLKSGGDGGN